MNNDYRYDILNDYISNISEQSSVRQYSDGSFCVSSYIDGKQLTVEGHYDVVVAVIKHLYEEFRDA
jgi:hypothetical protein